MAEPLILDVLRDLVRYALNIIVFSAEALETLHHMFVPLAESCRAVLDSYVGAGTARAIFFVLTCSVAVYSVLLDYYPEYARRPIDALTAEGRARIRERVEEHAQRERAQAQARIDEWTRERRERARRENAETDGAIEEIREELASRDRNPHVLRDYDKSTRLAFLETELLRLQEMVEHVPPKSARKRD